MSDNTIKAGDLVAVVRSTPCCNDNQGIGDMYTVTKIVKDKVMCNGCHAWVPVTLALQWDATKTQWGFGYAVTQLQKINPPAQSKTTTETKELSDVH